MQVEVRVKLKEQVLDPQGEAIRRALAGLGFAEVGQVRVGKLMLLEVGGDRLPARFAPGSRTRAARCSRTRSSRSFEVRLP